MLRFQQMEFMNSMFTVNSNVLTEFHMSQISFHFTCWSLMRICLASLAIWNGVHDTAIAKIREAHRDVLRKDGDKFDLAMEGLNTFIQTS